MDSQNYCRIYYITTDTTSIKRPYLNTTFSTRLLFIIVIVLLPENFTYIISTIGHSLLDISLRYIRSVAAVESGQHPRTRGLTQYILLVDVLHCACRFAVSNRELSLYLYTQERQKRPRYKIYISALFMLELKK